MQGTCHPCVMSTKRERCDSQEPVLQLDLCPSCNGSHASSALRSNRVGREAEKRDSSLFSGVAGSCIIVFNVAPNLGPQTEQPVPQLSSGNHRPMAQCLRCDTAACNLPELIVIPPIPTVTFRQKIVYFCSWVIE